jgi:hypothetical protein
MYDLLTNGDSTAAIPAGMTIALAPTVSSGLLGPAVSPLINNGNLNIIGSSSSTATLDLGNGFLLNNGTVTTSATGTPVSVVDGIEGDINNFGTVNIDASTGGVLIDSLIANNGVVNIASGQTLSLATFIQNAGTLSIAGTLIAGNFTDDGGTIIGTVNIGSSNAASASTMTIGTTAGNSGTFVLTSPSSRLTGGSGSMPPTIPNGMTVVFEPVGATNSVATLSAVTARALQTQGILILSATARSVRPSPWAARLSAGLIPVRSLRP